MAASGEKPYRVYRGGRTKGKVPLQRREREARRAVRSDGGGPGKIVERPPRRRRLWLGWTWRRWTLVTILGLIVLFVIWGALGYLSVSSGVSDANKRLPKNVRPVLTPDNGLLLSSPTTILLLGTDHATGKGSAGRARRPALRLDHAPPHRPRPPPPLLPLDSARPADARCPATASRRSTRRCSSAGRSSRSRRSTQLLGKSLPVNHVVIVDFNQFEKLDRRGRRDHRERAGEHPLEPLRLPVHDRSSAASQWKGWRFHKGPTHLNGHQALIFSRVRENQLDPSWTDFDRQHNQQLVEQATLSKLSSPIAVLLAALQRQLAAEADRDRPLDVAAHAARLGEVPGRAARSTAGSAGRATRTRSAT